MFKTLLRYWYKKTAYEAAVPFQQKQNCTKFVVCSWICKLFQISEQEKAEAGVRLSIISFWTLSKSFTLQVENDNQNVLKVICVQRKICWEWLLFWLLAVEQQSVLDSKDLAISSGIASLEIRAQLNGALKMVHIMKKTKKKSNFIFDIRAYHSGKDSGYYVFKTNDADS